MTREEAERRWTEAELRAENEQLRADGKYWREQTETCLLKAEPMRAEIEQLKTAAEPFRRVANIIDALPPSHYCGDDAPLCDVIPGEWPTVGDLRKLKAALTGNKP